jgi:hypothetical protein
MLDVPANGEAFISIMLLLAMEAPIIAAIIPNTPRLPFPLISIFNSSLIVFFRYCFCIPRRADAVCYHLPRLNRNMRLLDYRHTKQRKRRNDPDDRQYPNDHVEK